MCRLSVAVATLCVSLLSSIGLAQAQSVYVPRTSYTGDGTVLELIVTNPDPERSRSFRGVLLDEGADGTAAIGTSTEAILVAPKSTRIVAAPAGVGLWRLEGQAGLQIGARLRIPGGVSRQGEAVPVLNSVNVHPADATVEVQSLVGASGHLSDIGLFNAGDQVAVCEARVSRVDGAQIGPTLTLEVAPLSFTLLENVPGGLTEGAQVADARISMRCDQSFFVLSRTIDQAAGQVSIQTAATAIDAGLPDEPLAVRDAASSSAKATLSVGMRLNGVRKPDIGTVTSQPAGINCGKDCSQAYSRGTSVTLTAKAKAGYSFSHWSGGQGQCVTGKLVVRENWACIANFISGSASPPPPPPTSGSKSLVVRIKVNDKMQSGPTPAGSVTSTPAGISCGSDCTENLPKNTAVKLVAKANGGYKFSKWTGSQTDCSDGALMMGDNRDCTANFVSGETAPPVGGGSSGETSSLWGVSGELWNPTGRLPDVSRAGYREGSVALPSPQITHNVKTDFGAVGNGNADDTAAFRAALNAPSNSVVFIPAGRYKLTDALNITRGNVVLRGAGPDETVLYFTIPVKNSSSQCKNESGAGSWFGGMICVGFKSSPSVQEVGLEHFAIEFPPTPYPGHQKEDGYNGISFGKGVSNSWIRNVTLTDTDNGHSFRGAHHNTATGLVFKGDFRPGPDDGHHYIEVGASASYNLFTNFVFEQRVWHEISVAAGAHHNVFSKGVGVDIAFDHHTGNPYENVYTQIDVGKGTRWWKSGGEVMPYSGPRETYWNVHDENGHGPDDAPGYGDPSGSGPDAPYTTIVGATYTKFTTNLEWVEGLNPSTMSPQNIYEAQLKRRLGYVPTIE
jgi:hypothetical protein